MILGEYIRVSREEKDSNSLGEEAPRRGIREFARFRGIELEPIPPDLGVSGERPLARRAGGSILLSKIESGLDGVIVYKLDRLGRNVADIAAVIRQFEKSGKVLVSASEHLDLSTGPGLCMAHMLLAFAELERWFGSERSKSFHRVLREQGKIQGPTAPYGWEADEDGFLIEHTAEQAVLRRMRNLRSRGHSPAAIANALNDDNIPSKKGGKWRASSVKSVLERPRPQGTSTRRRETTGDADSKTSDSENAAPDRDDVGDDDR